MNKKNILWILIVCLFCFLGIMMCDRCTFKDLDEKSELKIKKANEKYGSIFKIEYIPYEFNYINVTILKPSSNNNVLIDSLHVLLYDKDKHEGWITLQIYDQDGKYLFSHGKNNNIYKQTGD